MNDQITEAATWISWRGALKMFLRGTTVPSGTRIALVVGTWLSLMNHGSSIIRGSFPWDKIALNYLTPFVVASLGFLAARRRSNVEKLAKLLDHDGRTPCDVPPPEPRPR
jgi:hypothetical protein